MAEVKGLFNKSKNSTVASRVTMATSFFKRLKGLLGTDSLDEDAGLFLSPCKSIHMFGMKYAIDAVFLDKELKVAELVERLEPGAVSGHYGDAHSCLELKAGMIEKLKISVGNQFEWNQS